MLALALTMLLAQDGGPTIDSTVDAGAPEILDVASGTLMTYIIDADGGTIWLEPRTVGEGCYLPTQDCLRIAKQKARTEAETKSWESGWGKWVAASFGVGLAMGFAVGATVTAVLKK